MTTIMTLTDRTAYLKNLKQEALADAACRGHQMSHFVALGENGHVCRAMCRNCGKELDIIVSPLPNETEVSGEVAAVNCPMPLL